MTNKKHALLSASSAHKWLEHPPISRLEQIAVEDMGVDDSNVYAEEGTAAHELAEFKLKKSLGIENNRPASVYHSDEMEAYTDDYVSFIHEQMSELESPLVLIEQRVDFSTFVPEGFGTADCILASGATLKVVDFKYGKTYVPVEDNPQMKLYALGAFSIFEAIYDIETIHLSIYQPRIGNIATWVIDLDALLEWANGDLKEKAELAYQGEGELNPGEWLKHTKIRAVSKDRANHHLELKKHELKEAHLLSDEEIEAILPQLDDLVRWAEDVKAYAYQQATDHNKEWSGFKLVEGRTTRKYMDVDLVEQRANEEDIKDIHEVKLKALTKLEKQIGNKKFNEIFGDLIMRSAGKIQLVPDSDGRPAIVRHDVKEDFK